MSALVASITLIFLYRHLTCGGREIRDHLQQGLPAQRDRSQGRRYPLFGIVGLLSFILIVLPVVVLFYTSVVPYFMVPSAKAFAMMSWRHWIAVLKDPVSLLSLKNSLYLGIGGATLGMILSFFVAYVIVKVRTKASGFLESLSFLSFSFPGIVVGIGFMWFFVRTPLYATIWALLIGYIATYLPYGIRPLTSAFVQIHGHLEESSRVCGGGPLHHCGGSSIPLLIPGIVSGWILMATMFVRELSLSVVLSRPGTEVLAVQILRFAEDGLWGRLSALGIIMILISSVLMAAASLLGESVDEMENGMNNLDPLSASQGDLQWGTRLFRNNWRAVSDNTRRARSIPLMFSSPCRLLMPESKVPSGSRAGRPPATAVCRSNRPRSRGRRDTA